MNRTILKNGGLGALAAMLVFAASPAQAGWLNDAVGAWVTETLTDLQTLGVSLAIIGFIVGVIMWVFSWYSFASRLSRSWLAL